MKERPTWRDYAIGVGVLVFLFVFIPVSLWQFSLIRERAKKQIVERSVPAILQDTDGAVRAAAEVLAHEVTSTLKYYSYQQTASSTRGMINEMCYKISESIGKHPGLVYNQSFCALYIKRGEQYITANLHNIHTTNYDYDLADLADLRNSSEGWKLYPNDRRWRVKYKISEDPFIVLDFEIGPDDRDWRGY